MTDTKQLLSSISALSSQLGTVRIMEVCGTHTNEIHRLGIRQALPENIKLVSGPGCPVCVTDESDIFKALEIAKKDNTVLMTYGDMLRVPCGDESLYSLKSSGFDVRIAYSALDALRTACEEPEKQVVFFAVGFETGTANTASLILKAKEKGVKNLSVLCAHKTMPQAIKTLLGTSSNIDGLLCPGHVAAVTGRKAFDFVTRELNLPAAVTGFTAGEILSGIYEILFMLNEKKYSCVNAYKCAVSESGNTHALGLCEKVFEPCNSLWRGLGLIENSGLKIKKDFSEFDALERFEHGTAPVISAKGCICGAILRGEKEPCNCKNFGVSCTPLNPVGPCMVSVEGSCAAFYKYGR